MNDLQRIEFDILSEVIALCNRLRLRYFLVCGSALGAAKYGGFIPWDDDVDIGLFREDYNVFVESAQALLPEHLFLQTHLTDLWYPHIFCKVRDSRTTYIEKSVARLDINHGVYIDVFPLDGYPQNCDTQKHLEHVKASCQRKLSCAFDVPRSIKGKIGMRIRRIHGFHKKTTNIVDAYTRAISQYPAESASVICNHGNWQGRLEYAPREQYGEGTVAAFEGLSVRIPEKYDAYLTQKYGDWRAALPLEQQTGHHFAEVIDLKRPYTDYIEHRKNGKIRIKRP